MAHSTDTNEVLTQRFRQALGMFGTGVTVVTALDEEGRMHGLTVSSFNSVSLKPPMVVWSQSIDSPSAEVFRRAAVYAVNVLNGDQEDLARHFARHHKDKFANVSYRLSPEGPPVLDGAAACFICNNGQQADGGDHTVYISQVRRFERDESAQPLIFWSGRFLVAGQTHGTLAPRVSAPAAVPAMGLRA